jgi:hypothetical protein
LSDKNFEGQGRHLGATLLLEQEVPDLRGIAVSDDGSILSGEPGDLADRNPQIIELFFYRALLVLSEQGIAAEGDEQGFFLAL